MTSKKKRQLMNRDSKGKHMDKPSTPNECENQPSPAVRSPLAIPELLSHVLNFLEPHELVGPCQVSRLFHDVCAPSIWKSICLDDDHVWILNKDFRRGMVRYGRLVQELHLTCVDMDAEDMLLIAHSCTRLRVLDLSMSDVRLIYLKALIFGDPYDMLAGSVDKPRGGTRGRGRGARGKQRAKRGSRSGRDHVGGCKHDMVELDKDMNKRMQSYRMTRDHESQFEWSLSSDFLGFKLQQYAKPPFPYFLEEVRLNYCNNLSGSSLAVISLLGPQLKSLSMDAVSDIGNDEVAKLLSHCTNVRSLSLKDTNITDQLLQLLAKAMDTHSTPSNQGLITIAPLKSLEIPGTEISDDGLVPLIRAIKGDLETFVIGDNYDITSETLFALVEDCQTTAGTQLGKATGNLGEQESEPAQLSKRIFVPNTVLTTIMFAGDFGIGDDGFTTLFQYATELKIIKLERCELEDEPLLALAETNRKRIENQGLGIPKAWYNHDLGDKRFELQSKSKKGRRKNKQPAPKFYTGGKVVGGLEHLSLSLCNEITNRGIRAIVRSCVKLEHLELVECSIVTMRVFRGPWVCNDIQSLNISGIRLRIPMELEFELVDEELCEIERFRIEPIKNFKKGLDFHADGTYDFLAAPIIDDPEFEVDEDFYRIMSANWGHGYNEDDEDDEDFENLWNDEDDWEGNLSDDDDDEDDEDDYDDYDSLDGRPYILGYPPRRYRNQTAHRMTMREFYTKLGQFKKLRSLDMSDADYRIRLHDGLHLALPGLRQSLQWWDITRHPKYRVEDDELIWIGKHFGYGSNYSDPYDEDQWEDVDEDEDEDEDEGEDKDGDEGKDEDEDEDTPKPRLGKLECLRISHYAAEGLDSGVAMWFEDQGIRLDLSYD